MADTATRRDLSDAAVKKMIKAAKARGFVTRHLSNAVNYVPGAFEVLANLVVVPFIVFFLLKDGRAMKKGFVRYSAYTRRIPARTVVWAAGVRAAHGRGGRPDAALSEARA